MRRLVLAFLLFVAACNKPELPSSTEPGGSNRLRPSPCVCAELNYQPPTLHREEAS